MRFLGATVAVLLLVACSPGGGQSPTPVASGSVASSPSITAAPIPSPSPTPTPSATVAPSAPASFPADLPTGDPESAAIIEGWQAYWRVYEKFAADPSLTDLTETQYVTTGEEANGILEAIAEVRDAGLRSEGGVVFRDFVVTVTGEGEAKLDYCVDLAWLRVVRIDNGEPFPRSGTFVEHARMERGVDNVWRVAQIRNEEIQC